MCAGPVGTGAVRRSGGAPTDKPDPPRIVGAPASGANVCRTGSHRAVRRSGGAPTDKPDPPRVVGAPAPGANMCLTGSHRGRVRMRARPVRTGGGAPTNKPCRRGLFGAGPGGGAAEHGGADEAAEFEVVVSFQGDAALVNLAAFRVVDATVLPGFAIAAGLHVPEDAQAFQRAVAQGFVRIFFVALGLAFGIQCVGDPHQVAAELVAAGAYLNTALLVFGVPQSCRIGQCIAGLQQAKGEYRQAGQAKESAHVLLFLVVADSVAHITAAMAPFRYGLCITRMTGRSA